MVIRPETVASLSESCRSDFISRAAAAIRSEFPEFQPLSDSELRGLVSCATDCAERAGIVEEDSAVEFAALFCGWSALTASIDPPRWFDAILRDTSLDGAAKVRGLRERSRIEVLAYGEFSEA
jgi:hypothetical protein